MVETEELEDILHREKMKEPLPKYDGQTQEEWQQEMDNIIDTYIPYGHKNKWTYPFVNLPVSEYSRKIGYHLELQRLDYLELHMKNAWRMLLMWSMWPVAVLVFLLSIYIWG